MSPSLPSVVDLVRLQNHRLESLIKQLEIFNHPTTPKTSTLILQKKMEIFERNFEEFHQTDDEIRITEKTEDDKTKEYFAKDIAQIYFNTHFQLLDSIDRAITSNLANETPIVESSRLRSKIKLPVLQPPTFSGKYTEWNAFWDQFTAMIDSNPEIPEVQKLQYLQAAVKGTAKDKIKHLTTREIHYESAKTLLRQQFENKRAIFTDAMSHLISTARSKRDSVAELQQLSTVVQETMQSLKNIDVNEPGIIVAHLIIDKFPPELRKEFERKTAESNQIPSIDDVKNQIQLGLRALESLESSKGLLTSEEYKPKTKLKSFVMTKKTPMFGNFPR